MEKYSELLGLAIKTAILAGKEIMSVYANEISVEIKDDKSPLTEADKRSHHKIIEGLNETSLPVLSEEGKMIPYDSRNKWELFWLVDPLDGTKEFIKRNGEFTVNIALIKGNTPVAGVIYAPIIDSLYFAAEGIGSFKLEANFDHLHALSLSENITDKFVSEANKLPTKNSERKFTVVASRSHMSEETQSFIEELRLKHGELDLISKGSSLKLCLVAEGAADVYPRFAPTMEWDTAAGQAIAMFAGFKVYNPTNLSPIIYNKEDLLNPWFVVG